MSKTEKYKAYANRVEVSREEAIADKLTDDKTNIRYVAAYLAYWQDRWKEVFPEIDKRTDVLATLYNQGEVRQPHSNPMSNPFGDYAKENYARVLKLLGL